MSKETFNQETSKKLQLLLQSLDKVYPSLKQLMLRSFIQGVFVGLGTTIGVSLVLGVITFLLAQARVVPELNQVIDYSQIDTILEPDL